MIDFETTDNSTYAAGYVDGLQAADYTVAVLEDGFYYIAYSAEPFKGADIEQYFKEYREENGLEFHEPPEPEDWDFDWSTII